MNETHADYNAFMTLALSSDILTERDRELLQDERVQELFTLKVDHPMGYEDGGSAISYTAMNRICDLVSHEERMELCDIADKLLDSDEDYTPEEKRDLLLGINQLVQPTNYKMHWRYSGYEKVEKILEKIATEYEIDCAPVKEWEAQKAENIGFWHAGEQNGQWFNSVMAATGGLIPLAFLGACFPEAASYISEIVNKGGNTIENLFYVVITAWAISGYLEGSGAVACAQDIGKSPVYKEELINSKHFRFMRHPMYGNRILNTFLTGIMSMNPIGWYFAAKSIYHGVRACQEQDRRIRILYGEEAEEYQQKVPAFIPGTNLLMKGLDKILPEKVTNALKAPLSDYLGKISFIRREPEFEENFRGKPNSYVGTPEERKKAGKKQLKEFLGLFNPMAYVRAVKDFTNS